MKRVYVAGKYSADNVISILDNIRVGIKTSAAIMKLGISPFCPWLDYPFQFFEKLEVKDFYNYSMAWLEVSDEVWVLPDWKNSKGTIAEIKRAKELNIPVRFLQPGRNRIKFDSRWLVLNIEGGERK